MLKFRRGSFSPDTVKSVLDAVHSSGGIIVGQAPHRLEIQIFVNIEEHVIPLMRKLEGMDVISNVRFNMSSEIGN